MSNIRRSMMMRKKGCKILYEASNLVFDGTGGIDTGVKLFESDIDFEIDCEISNVKTDYVAGSVAYYVWFIVNSVTVVEESNVGLTQRYSSARGNYLWWDTRVRPGTIARTPNYVGHIDRVHIVKIGRTSVTEMYYQGTKVHTDTIPLKPFVPTDYTLVLGSAFGRHVWCHNVIGTINHIIVKQL